MFRQKVKMMIAVLEELNRRIHQSNVTALPGDARQLPISDTSIDLVVPLLTLMHWTITASIQYNIAWLGMDYKAFQRQEIGGHSQLLLS